MITPGELQRILVRLPEKQLRLIELAWELLPEGGRLDAEQISRHMAEIQLAVKEAEAYSQANHHLALLIQRGLKEAP